MIASKNPSKPISNTKIVILQIAPDEKIKANNNIFKSHKLRKLQSIQASRRSKAMKALQKMDFKDFLLESLPGESLPVAPTTQRSHRSSYLAYKQEQRLNKVKHNNKLSCLRNKIIQHPLTLEVNIPPRNIMHTTYQASRAKRKMSMVILGESLSEGNQEAAALSKSRNIYIKTSYGKRQKIDPNTYMTKIKEKIHNLCDQETSNHIASFSSNYIQTINNDAHIKMQPFSQERHNITRNIRARNFKKEQELLIQDDGVNQCRPWTSRNSDYPQQ